jgi:hypothetical protein
VRLAIDATEHVPLRVEVYARNATKPAFEVAFQQISFQRPAAEWFRFNPPPGARVHEQTDQGGPSAPAPSVRPRSTVIGQGWTSVLVLRPSTSAEGTKPGADEMADGLLAQLPTVSGSWGRGRLLAGNLFSVLLTDDGRVLAGAVSPDRLYRAAADPAARLGR